MPIDYLCLKEMELCLVVWDGSKVLPEEWFDHLRRMGGDPEVLASRFHLCDLRLTTLHESFGENALEEGARYLASVPGLLANRKAAVVAGEEFAKSRIFERLVRPYSTNIIVFNSLDVACTWLGVDAEEIGDIAARLRAKIHNAA